MNSLKIFLNSLFTPLMGQAMHFEKSYTRCWIALSSDEVPIGVLRNIPNRRIKHLNLKRGDMFKYYSMKECTKCQ